MLVAVFNRVVDPFWYYRDISISGINSIKPKFQNYERHVKPALVRREQPASLIFGSSYSEIGFDPLHPALTSAGKSYNFAMAGASWDMVACNVKFALANDTALRQIVLGIHTSDMPLVDCKTRLENIETSERPFLFSLDALSSSINTVLEQRTGKSSHSAEGLYYYTRGKPETAERFRKHFALYTPCKIGSPLPDPPNTATARKKLDLAGLRQLVHDISARGIELKLVVYPRHALSFEQEYQCGMRTARWDNLAQIVSAADSGMDHHTEVWDFEGYHEIGTEAITNSSAIYWQDPEHFNYEFGNIMLDEMFALKPSAYGMRLTSSNLAKRAETERRMRSDYIASHPDFLKQLESLLPQKAN